MRISITTNKDPCLFSFIQSSGDISRRVNFALGNLLGEDEDKRDMGIAAANVTRRKKKAKSNYRRISIEISPRYEMVLSSMNSSQRNSFIRTVILRMMPEDMLRIQLQNSINGVNLQNSADGKPLVKAVPAMEVGRTSRAETRPEFRVEMPQQRVPEKSDISTKTQLKDMQRVFFESYD